ncbi:MAG TPA: ATPase, partial [Thermotoga sp.]|nr:ATPase [Thermotoga sp.]
MRYFLGVDGGGTKTQAVLVTEDGELVSERTGGPTNILENGEETFRKNLEDILKPILMKA